MIIWLFIALSFSCTKDEADLRLPNHETPKINGYYVRNRFSEFVRTIGDPIIKNGIDSNNNIIEYITANYNKSIRYFMIYPNPCRFYLNLYTRNFDSNSVKKVWITRAQYGVEIPNSYISIGMINKKIGGAPIYQKKFYSDDMTIETKSFSNEYYRIYLEIDSIILYDNLVIYKPKNDEL